MLLLLGTVMFLELLIFNSVILYVYSNLSSELSLLTSGSGSFMSKLLSHDKVNQILLDLKSNSVYSTLLQETVERMYITHHRHPGSTQFIHDEGGKTLRDVGFIGVDVSHSKESTYIYQRILLRKDFPYHFLVVDIGANDGFLSSNSFNFIQWGWDAVLVDPQPRELQTAKKNLQK